MSAEQPSAFEQVLINEVQNLMPAVNQLLSSRSRAIASLIDPRRNVDKEFRYPQAIGPVDYMEQFRRNGLARRVVEVYPLECWATRPCVYETEDETQETDFETAWSDIVDAFQVYDYLKRADVLSGIGRYGVILLGLNDGATDLTTPVRDGAGPEFDDDQTEGPAQPQRKLTYIRVMPETLAMVSSWQTDPANPRYGQPETYTLSMVDPEEVGAGSTFGDLGTAEVHWTRIIHLADGCLSSEVLGTPRMQSTFNWLLDVKKVAGADAEGYYQGAFPGLSIESSMDLTQGTVQYDLDKTKQSALDYLNGLQRILTLVGFQAKSLSPQVVDPTPHIDNLVKLIAATIGVPLRVLLGSEVGQLAGEQDTGRWNDRIQGRQNEYLVPNVLRRFVDRLIWLGVLPKPKDTYTAEWEQITNDTEAERVDLAGKKITTINAYVSGGAEQELAPVDFWTKIMGLEQDEAEAIMENAQKNAANVNAPGDVTPMPGQQPDQTGNSVPPGDVTPGYTTPQDATDAATVNTGADLDVLVNRALDLLEEEVE